MINANELMTAETDVGNDPYEESLDYTTRFTYDKLDKIINYLYQLVNYSERQREKQAPTVVDLSPSSGYQVTRTYNTKTKLRVSGIVISGGSGDKIQMNIGSVPYIFYSGNAGPQFFQFPIEIAQGIDLSAADVTNPSSVAWSFYIIAYPV